MARTLYLFSGLTPNIKGHPFFNIKVFSNYLNYLIDNYTLEKTINDDNYRINAGVIKITLQNYTGNKTLTYAVEVDSANAETYHRCYFIDSITEQSGMLYLDTSIDYWGSYYLAENLEHFKITRCNRNVGRGIYDDIITAPLLPLHTFFEGDIQLRQQEGNIYWGLEDTELEGVKGLTKLKLIILLNYNTKQSIFSSNKVSTIGFFADNLYWPSSIASHGKYMLRHFARFVAGIFATYDGTIDHDAQVLRAYLIPSSLVKTFNNKIKVKSKFTYEDGSDAQIIGELTEVIPCQTIKNFTIENYDINFNYIAGTCDNAGLKLTRFTDKNLNFQYICDIRQNDLTIKAKQGDNEFDITENFVIDILGGTTEETSIRKLANNFSKIASIINATSRGYNSGEGNNKFGAFLKGGTSIANLVEGFSINSNLLGNGDALSVYDLLTDVEYGTQTAQYVRTPYCVNKYASIVDERKNARINGASFNDYFEDINSIFDYELLGTGDYDLTYIVANDIKLNNLPTIARQQIENAFANGVELFDYEGSTGE